MSPVELRVPPSAAGWRLDRFLALHFDEARNQVQKWIRGGQVSVEGKVAKSSQVLAEGESISCQPLPREQEGRIEPEEGELPLLYADEHLLVVDKPAGLVVHPGAGRSSGTLAHRILAAYPETGGVGGPGRPGIVHRLDKGTSGLILVARSRQAYQALTSALAERRIEKTYLAIAYGIPKETSGRIDSPIGRHPQRRKEMAVLPKGRPALTHFELLSPGAGGISLWRLGLETGRTHQIRVHLKSVGHPLVGDTTYGGNRWKGAAATKRSLLLAFPRPALHAWQLALRHPASDEPLSFTAPVPNDLIDLWQQVTASEFPSSPQTP